MEGREVGGLGGGGMADTEAGGEGGALENTVTLQEMFR
eukprot:COSAG02_NODE_4370_length_5442_cov_338.841475_3_plen_38_part_00